MIKQEDKKKNKEEDLRIIKRTFMLKVNVEKKWCVYNIKLGLVVKHQRSQNI